MEARHLIFAVVVLAPSVAAAVPPLIQLTLMRTRSDSDADLIGFVVRSESDQRGSETSVYLRLRRKNQKETNQSGINE